MGAAGAFIPDWITPFIALFALVMVSKNTDAQACLCLRWLPI